MSETGIVIDEGNGNELNANQKDFYRAYFDKNSDTYHNGVRSYLKVYYKDVDYLAANEGNEHYKAAGASAARLLANVRAIAKMTGEEVGLDTANVIRIGLKNAADFNRKDQLGWWKEICYILDIRQDNPILQTVNNTQININQDQKTAAEWNDNFAKFLESGQAPG